MTELLLNKKSDTPLWQLSPNDFCRYLQQQLQTSRCHFVRITDHSSQTGVGNGWVASHAQLQPLADHFASCSDYDDHEALFIQIGPQSGVLQSACIHRTCRGNAAGGVRFWYYQTVGDLIRDGMRLGCGMTLKNALAGLWHGGGKGVMAKNSGCYQSIDHHREASALYGHNNNNNNNESVCSTLGDAGDDQADAEILSMRQTIFEEYGQFITSLHGVYVTAEDVGVTERDMRAVFSKTRYTTCIPVELGGSGNPSGPTARGVARGLQAAFKFIGKPLSEAVIAVQGVGHVGSVLVRILLGELGVRRVIGTSMSSTAAIRQLQQDFNGQEQRFEFRLVDRGDLSALFEPVDAVCPCAVGGILNPDTIPQIKARIVCGAANNQLLDMARDSKLLHSRGILFIPDFLVNRMGIVCCADEPIGYVIPRDQDANVQKHLGDDWDQSIFNLTIKILEQSANDPFHSPQQIALALADKASRQPNPLFGHRGLAIARSYHRAFVAQ